MHLRLLSQRLAKSSSRALFVLVVTAILLGGCAKEVTPQLEVEDLKYQQLPSGARIVSGELYNPSDKLVPNAQLQLSLFDEDNIFVSTMFIVVRSIPAGERVSFREPVDVKFDVKATRVKSVLVL